MPLYTYRTAEESARALAARVNRSRRHTAEVRSSPVELLGEFIGTHWSVFIKGENWFDRSATVFWWQPVKGRACLQGGYLDKYANHRNNIKLGKYDYRTLEIWLAVCVGPYEEEAQ